MKKFLAKKWAKNLRDGLMEECLDRLDTEEPPHKAIDMLDGPICREAFRPWVEELFKKAIIAGWVVIDVLIEEGKVGQMRWRNPKKPRRKAKAKSSVKG